MKVLFSPSISKSVVSTEPNEPKSVKQLPSVPTFKAGKLKIKQELKNSVYNNININSSMLKDIMNNQEQRNTFFATISSIIVSTAVAITQAIHGNNSDTKAEKIIEHKKESDIKFLTTRGKCPQIEKDIISFTNEQFKDDSISADKIKLLFNEYCGKNRNGVHLFEGQVVENKVLIKQIFEELKANYDNKSELYSIISKYMSLEHVDRSIITPVSADNTTKKSDNLSGTKAQEGENVDKNLEKIKSIFTKFEDIYHIDNIVTKLALKNIAKNFSDDTKSLLSIIQSLNETEAKTFMAAMANKAISPEAVKAYNNEVTDNKLTFLQYNNLKILQLNDDAIQQLSELIYTQTITNISTMDEPNSFFASFPSNISICKKFEAIQDGFEIITSQKTTLNSHKNSNWDQNSLINELKQDFWKNDKHTTYKNIMAYLYGNKHVIRTEKDFEKHQYSSHFTTLISLLNNDKIFNNNLFSNINTKKCI